MDKLNLHPVIRIDSLEKVSFVDDFLKPNQPVVLRSFAAQWPAMQKWDYSFLKRGCGDVNVPLYSEAFAGSGNDYLATDNTMRFADYLDLIAKEPTQLRMFLFNIFKYMPQLCEDFYFPDLGVSWLQKFPFVFFGGEGSYVDIHYDLDHSHVFLTQFIGHKQVILYAPRWSKHLYRHPFTVSSNVNLHQPDWQTYPKVPEAQGFVATLQHGDTLFIPSKWWHYIEYTTGGFSMALRAMPSGLLPKVSGLLSIGRMKLLDYNIGRIMGHKRWYQIKERMAQHSAQQL